MSLLIRTAAGPFSIERSYSISELENCPDSAALMDTLVSCEDALAHLPKLMLPSDRIVPAKNGLETMGMNFPDGEVRAYGADAFLGIGTVANGAFKLKVHLYD